MYFILAHNVNNLTRNKQNVYFKYMIIYNIPLRME